jgi:hypothetical protein
MCYIIGAAGAYIHGTKTFSLMRNISDAVTAGEKNTMLDNFNLN